MATSFKDAKNRQWTVTINTNTFKRVKAMMDVDLSGLFAGEMAGLLELINNPVKLVDVLYCIVKPQAEDQGVTDEQFGEALTGDVLGRGLECFMSAYIDFFHDPAMRAEMRKAWSARKALTEKIQKLSEERNQSLDWDAAAEAIFKQSVEKVEAKAFPLSKFVKPSTVAPESSGSTQDPSPSAS